MVQHLTPDGWQTMTGVVERQKCVLRAKVIRQSEWRIRSFRAFTKCKRLLAPNKVSPGNLPSHLFAAARKPMLSFRGVRASRGLGALTARTTRNLLFASIPLSQMEERVA
jgi:hypothetical protein